MGSHYSNALDPGLLLEWAEDKAVLLLGLTLATPSSSLVLCYRGMSGVAHATALSMSLARRDTIVKMVYVRKAEEDSHGNPMEWSDAVYDDDTIVFVDDFISTGKTYEAVIHGMRTGYPIAMHGDRNIDYVCLARQTANTRAYINKHNLKVI